MFACAFKLTLAKVIINSQLDIEDRQVYQNYNEILFRVMTDLRAHLSAAT